MEFCVTKEVGTLILQHGQQLYHEGRPGMGERKKKRRLTSCDVPMCFAPQFCH